MTTAARDAIFRSLPSVDEVLRSDPGTAAVSAMGADAASVAVRSIIARLRDDIASDKCTARSRSELLSAVEAELCHTVREDRRSGIRRVINATGVVIHTNLGRAPLSEAAQQAILSAAAYSTVEYELAAGGRGRRGARAERLAAEIVGAEDAVVVNNCAAAAFFVLSVFACGGEVLVSRGELVEIGGDFRIPDVLEASGARLREVGTTNRTKLADYERAIGPDTRMLLRVHPSNYRIVGFTARPSVADLAGLAAKTGLLLYDDIGSGALVDTVLEGEAAVSDSIKAGADLVTFSGDKLLGGPQAGLIAGRADFIGTLRKHPMYRILRADKLTYAGLEATLDQYRRRVVNEVPVQRMLSLTREEIGRRAAGLRTKVEAAGGKASIRLMDGSSAVGGGAGPGLELPTVLVLIDHPEMSASRIEYHLRSRETPVIVRIVDDRAVIDLRTVDIADEADLADAILSL